MKTYIKSMTLGLIAIAVYICTIIFSGDISAGVKEATERCINIIIPSLFIYMALSKLVIETGCINFVLKPLSPIIKVLFHMSTELFCIFFLSNICGYPIGASLLDSLWQSNKLNKNTAEKALCYCYGGGPSFLIGIVGSGLYGDKQAGLLIFYSCIIANAIIMIVMNLFLKPALKESESKIKKPDIISVISGSAHGIFKICAVIVAFSAVCTMLGIALDGVIDKNVLVFIKSFAEITSITALTNKSVYLLPIIAAISSFGGICILLQLKAVTRLSIKPLILSRLVACPLSASICALLVYLTDFKPSVTTTAIKIETSAGIPSIILCVILAMFFIFTQEESNA